MPSEYSESVFRRRGVDVQVDTSKPAEFDIKGYQISDASLEKIGKRLKTLPVSPEDKVVNGFRIRTHDNYDVIFDVSRDKLGVTVTILGIIPIQEESTLSAVRAAIETIAATRGALGV